MNNSTPIQICLWVRKLEKLTIAFTLTASLLYPNFVAIIFIIQLLNHTENHREHGEIVLK